MIHRLSRFQISLIAFALTAAAHADPLAELQAFSSFKTVNLDKLASGTVQATRGPAMSFPRGLAVESCYVVRKPLAKTVAFHQQWSPARHSDLKVWLHTDLTPRAGIAEFQKLRSAPANSAVRAFVAATQKLGAGPGDLQLSKAEANAFESTPGSDAGAMPAKVADFWSGILSQRAQAFVSGGPSRQPAYENANGTIRVADDISRLLKESGKMRGQFSAVLDGAGLSGGKGALTPSLYWELVGVEDDAALNLGASYSKAGPNTWQGVEAQYYATSGYCAFITLTQMWPITIGGQEMTLVWQGDLISSNELASLHGVERMGSSTAMMRETQKFIGRFAADANKAP